MSQLAHVKAVLDDDEYLKPLTDVLEPICLSVDAQHPLLSGKQEAEFLAKGTTKLTVPEYNALLWYLRDLGRPYFSVLASIRKLAEPEILLLPPYVRKRTEVLIGDKTFSTQTSHEGNSAVQFVNPRTAERGTGYVEEIWSLPLEHRISTFFVVRPHSRLPEIDEQKAPFSSFSSKYATRIVSAVPSERSIIVEHRHIITHLSTYRRPAGTYGIPYDTLVVCWALNRGKR